MTDHDAWCDRRCDCGANPEREEVLVARLAEVERENERLRAAVVQTLREIILAEVEHQPLLVQTFRTDILEECHKLEAEGLLWSEPYSTVHDAVLFHAVKSTKSRSHGQ